MKKAVEAVLLRLFSILFFGIAICRCAYSITLLFICQAYSFICHISFIVTKFVTNLVTEITAYLRCLRYFVTCNEVGGNTITPTSRPPPPHSTEYGRHAVACSDRAQLSWYALRRTVRGDTPTTQPLTESLS